MRLSETLRDLADWFSQDFDIISGSLEKAVEGFYAQNGERSARDVLKTLNELLERFGYSERLGVYLEAHGWEWFPCRDKTGKYWMPKLIEELGRNINSMHTSRKSK
jgi:hypothetical protein